MSQNVIPLDREDPEVYVRLLPVFVARRDRRAAVEARRRAVKREKLLQRIAAAAVGIVTAAIVMIAWMGAGM